MNILAINSISDRKTYKRTSFKGAVTPSSGTINEISQAINKTVRTIQSLPEVPTLNDIFVIIPLENISKTHYLNAFLNINQKCHENTKFVELCYSNPQETQSGSALLCSGKHNDIINKLKDKKIINEIAEILSEKSSNYINNIL